MKKFGIMAVGAMVAVAAVAESIESQWKGKKVAFLGDSITDHVTSATNYWGYLELELGITPLVYGVNGHQMSMIKGQAENLKNEHGDDVDAIFIFAGTNDYNADCPLGKWYTYADESRNWHGTVATAPRRHFALDANTFRGRINIALDYIKDNFPKAQVVIMTPIHRGYANFGSNNIQPEETFANPSGLHIDDYVAVVREAGGVWSVPVIDLFAECGLFPVKDAFVPYFKSADNDRLHPNPEGHRRIARAMTFRMLAMPSTFRD